MCCYYGQTRAEECFEPKKIAFSTITEFRVSSMNVECMVIFSMLTRALTFCVAQNHYVNTSIQTGGILGVCGINPNDSPTDPRGRAEER